MPTHSNTSSNRKQIIKQRHREVANDLLPYYTAQLYIGGNWVDSASGQTLQTRDPTTGEVLAEVQAGNEADIDRAVDAAWEAYDDCWAAYSTADRQRILTEIADRIETRREEFAKLESLDNGKPITESRDDIELVIDHFRYFAGAARFLEGKTIPTDSNNHIQTIKEPYGVVGQITPWNFPLLMASWKLAPALAAGNTTVLKPAEQTPLSIIEFIRETEDVLPPGVVNLITGYGAEAGAPLVSHDDVRKIAFTGSTEVGHGVMKNTANSITDLTLELGGKSPVIVFPDADIEKAVTVTTKALFFNAGECCCAGTRLLIHEDIYDQFLPAYMGEVGSLTVGDPLLDETELGPKVSQAELERTMRYIGWAQEADAEILTGGGPPDDEALTDGNFVAPTVISDLDHESRVAQEEIFGPVEAVFRWSSYDTMIELANDTQFGLAAGIITDDLDSAYKTARDIEAGNIWINTYNEFQAGQPFGGYKQSGTGRETAFETLEEYTQTKSINVGFE
ncbi:aldehyde dehydrogenase family protein [Haladaptatus sp. DYF46]|uniref:aldehyde dehydrogenase family protein n=1 Tax=Haladaptatus sp. DYF46 TaxID=2886041 RepID=UPI001E521D67|nr:aldehyde dehydrogenase family protein [Haladaptatus sp. DYF46]